MLTSAGLPSLDTLLADTSDDAVPSDPLRFVGNPNSERVVRTGFAHADVTLANVVPDRLRPPSVLLPTNVEQRRRILLQHASPELAAAVSSSSPPLRRQPSEMSYDDPESEPEVASAVGHSIADAVASAVIRATSAYRAEAGLPELPSTPPGHRGQRTPPDSPPAFSSATDLFGRRLETPLSYAQRLAQLPSRDRRNSDEEYAASLMTPRPGSFQPARTRDSEPAAAAASSSAAAADSSGSPDSPMELDDDSDDEDESNLQRVMAQSFNEQFLPDTFAASAAASSSLGAETSSRAPAAAAASSNSPAAAAASSSRAPAAAAAAAADESDEDEDLDPDGPVAWGNVVNVSSERRAKMSCIVGMCSNVPLNGPHMHHKCRHYLCAPCFDGLARSSSTTSKCPGCRQPIASSEPSEVRNDAMADLKARCIYHRSGCTTVTTLENGGKHEKAHRQRCDFRPMPCKFCKTEFTAKKLAKHQAECYLRLVNCDLCNNEMAATDLPAHRTSPLGPAYCQSHNFCPNRCFSKVCGVQPTAKVLDRLRTMSDASLLAPGALDRLLSGFKNPTVKVVYKKPVVETGAAAEETATSETKDPPPRLAIITANRLEHHLETICPCRMVDCVYPGCTDSIPHSHGGSASSSSSSGAAVANPKKRKLVAHELPGHIHPDNKKTRDAHMLAMAERIRELTRQLTSFPRNRTLLQVYNLCIAESRLADRNANLSDLYTNVNNHHLVLGSVAVSGLCVFAGHVTVKFSPPRLGMSTAFEAVVTVSAKRLRPTERLDFVMDKRATCDVSMDDQLRLWPADSMRTEFRVMPGERVSLINIKIELYQ